MSEPSLPPPKKPGHEKRDASVIGVLLTGVGLAAILVVSCLLVLGLFDRLKAREPLGRPVAGQLPPPPRLEGVERMQERKLVAAPGRSLPRLDSYGWVDKDKGIVRIPLERAMELIVEKQLLPAKPAKPAQGER